MADSPTAVATPRRETSVTHAAALYRARAHRLFLQAKNEVDSKEKRALIRHMEQLMRLAVDLEKKAARDGGRG